MPGLFSTPQAYQKPNMNAIFNIELFPLLAATR